MQHNNCNGIVWLLHNIYAPIAAELPATLVRAPSSPALTAPPLPSFAALFAVIFIYLHSVIAIAHAKRHKRTFTWRRGGGERCFSVMVRLATKMTRNAIYFRFKQSMRIFLWRHVKSWHHLQVQRWHTMLYKYFRKNQVCEFSIKNMLKVDTT